MFIDARKLGSPADRTHSELTDESIQKLSDTFTAFQNGTLEDVKGYCAVVSTEKIGEENYDLLPGRYVGIEDSPEDDEPFGDKMKRLTTELGGMFTKSHELEEQIKKNLEGIGFKI